MNWVFFTGRSGERELNKSHSLKKTLLLNNNNASEKYAPIFGLPVFRTPDLPTYSFFFSSNNLSFATTFTKLPSFKTLLTVLYGPVTTWSPSFNPSTISI